MMKEVKRRNQKRFEYKNLSVGTMYCFEPANMELSRETHPEKVQRGGQGRLRQTASINRIE